MRSLIIACILIALAAIAAPKFFAQYMEEPRGRDMAAGLQEAEAAEGEGARSSAGPRQVEIEAEGDGHFYVEAEINSEPVRLMVDTGATVVALRVSDAEAAGIRARLLNYDNPIQTANGTTMAAETVIDRIAIKDIEVYNIRALVVPDNQLSLSLLGGSFLNGLDRFEVADGRLIFEN